MLFFKDRIEWLESLPKNLVIAEVGVYRGEFAVEIYNRCRPNKFYLIDCWESQEGEYERDPTNLDLAANKNQIFENVKKMFSGRDDVEIIKGFSTEACKIFSKSYFDVVYIDADHTFDAVLKDLNDWWPLVKPGGFMAGHDYIKGIPWIDVFDALNLFMSENSLDFYSLSQEEIPSWSIRKIA